jgi:hypothetical protein
VDQIFQLSTQHSSVLLETTNVQAIILMYQYHDDIDQELSNNKCEDPGEYTLSSNIEEDDLDNWQDVLPIDQACCNRKVHTTRVPLPKKRCCAYTFIAWTELSNLQHPVGTIAPSLLKCQQSVINISRESDVVQSSAKCILVAWSLRECLRGWGV